MARRLASVGYYVMLPNLYYRSGVMELWPFPTEPAALEAAIVKAKGGGVHGVQAAAVSITNVTEAGTVHSVAEVAALAGVARAHGLPVHLDGARFAHKTLLGCPQAFACKLTEIAQGVFGCLLGLVAL